MNVEVGHLQVQNALLDRVQLAGALIVLHKILVICKLAYDNNKKKASC